MIESIADMHTHNEHVLRMAAYHGDYETVKFLIQNGADVTADDNEALANAASQGHFDIVRLLIDPTYEKETPSSTFLDQQLNDHLEKYKVEFYKIYAEKEQLRAVECFIAYIKNNMVKQWRLNDTRTY